METVIAEKGRYALVKMESVRQIGKESFKFTRYEIRYENKYVRGLSGMSDADAVELFNNSVLK